MMMQVQLFLSVLSMLSIFQLFIFVFSAAAAAVEEKQSVWNSVLGTADSPIVPAQYDALTGDNSGEDGDWKMELQKFGALLQHPRIGIRTVYANYLKSYKKNDALSSTTNSPANDGERLTIFRENLMLIASHNLKAASEGPDDYRMGVNAFTDLSEAEFVAHYTGHTPRNRSTNSDELTNDLVTSHQTVGSKGCRDTKKAKDWRSTGDVSSIKDQQTCGSCLAHATTAALESAYAIHKGKKGLDFSRQEIIDCTRVSCAGGGDWPDAYPYIIKTGVATDQSYPYENKDSKCRAAGKAHVAKGTRWSYVSERAGGEGKMKEVVGSKGPLAVGIFVGRHLQNHGQGVFTGPCKGEINHAVAIVGYGTENCKDYWLIKNSWGTSWSEKGFGKIQRGINLCSISEDATQVSV